MVSDSKCNSSDSHATDGNPQGKGSLLARALRIWRHSWNFNLKTDITHVGKRQEAGHFTLNMQALLFCLLLAGLASVIAQATSGAGAGQVTLYSVLHAPKLKIWLVWSRSCPVWWGEWPGSEPHPDGESGKPGGGSSWVKLLQQQRWRELDETAQSTKAAPLQYCSQNNVYFNMKRAS